MPALLKSPEPAPAFPSLAEIEREIDRRQREPKSPAALAEIASRGRWVRARHLDLLDEKLVALAEGRIKRLIVTMPPRHGKSKLCSEYFPAWFIGRHPDRRVILCSYEANFAAEWGSKARDVLSQYGPDLFDVSVRQDKSARDDWAIAGRVGGMVTAGVGGAITGKGANLLIIDDPVKNAEEANSETYREKTWNWWTSTAFTRLEPDASVLIVQTRWHEDDLTGRLLKQDTEDEDDDTDERWEVLNLPAIAELGDALGRKPDEPLWPERWGLAKLLKRMRRLGQYVWNALYQQRPTSPKGNYFKRAWFEAIDRSRVPSLIDVVRQWDLAATAEGEGGNTDPDWLAGVKIGKSAVGMYYVLDVIRERVSANEVELLIKRTAGFDGRACKVRIEQEGAASGKIVKYHFLKMLDGYDCRFQSIPKSSKMTRSGPFNAACERGDVKLVKGEWNDAFIEELASFPNGTHDDQVDAASAGYADLSGEPVDWDVSDVAKVFAGNAKKSRTESPLELLRRNLNR